MITCDKIYVRVKTHSHQYYTEVSGELLLATHGVERYDSKYMQVPALLIKTTSGIAFVKLEKECYHTDVEFITEDEFKKLE